MAGKSIGVLIVDDSALMRFITADILKSAGGFDILDFASDGREAALKCKLLKPDVVVMDMVMGDFDGVEGVSRIMKECPTPIVILSGAGDSVMTSIKKALKLGAVDFHCKPVKKGIGSEAEHDDFVRKLVAAAGVIFTDVPRQSEPGTGLIKNHHSGIHQSYDLIVIGASTGGPVAVECILKSLPADLSVPVLVAQHMPCSFVPSFAERLNQLSVIPVEMARKGEPVIPGKVLVAPGSRNMVLAMQGNTIVTDFTAERFREYNFPSVNGLMQSAAEICGAKTLGVILTGMGRDGAAGLKAIKDAGGFTIAQSEETCVVYGMPRAAVEIDAVCSIVPLSDIASVVLDCIGSKFPVRKTYI